MKLPAAQQLQFTECYRDAVNQYFNDIFSRLPKNTQRAYISDFNKLRCLDSILLSRTMSSV